MTPAAHARPRNSELAEFLAALSKLSTPLESMTDEEVLAAIPDPATRRMIFGEDFNGRAPEQS